jgi:hypothetical protein
VAKEGPVILLLGFHSCCVVCDGISAKTRASRPRVGTWSGMRSAYRVGVTIVSCRPSMKPGLLLLLLAAVGAAQAWREWDGQPCLVPLPPPPSGRQHE